MDALDAVIVLLLVLFAWIGYRRGVSWVGPALIGLAVGVVAGVFLAPWLAHAVVRDGNRNFQATIAAATFVALVLLLEGVGTAVGFHFRLRTIRTKYSAVDSWAGSALSFLGVLASAWLVGLVFAQSQWQFFDQQIQNSAILRTITRIGPAPPAVVADLQHIVSGVDWPNPFTTLGGPNVPTLAIPPGSEADTPGISAAVPRVVKVISESGGCETVDAGSGWPVAQNYIVTNAHVVAGGDRISVDLPDGSTRAATVVEFDPNLDIAVLYVPRLGLTPFKEVVPDPTSGTQGAVIGYPGGQAEQVVPAIVRGTEEARGNSIYNDTVTRDIEVLGAQVIPGNSGGPMLDRSGDVIGVVFAASTTTADEGYALSLGQIQADVSAGVGSTQPVSTEMCTS